MIPSADKLPLTLTFVSRGGRSNAAGGGDRGVEHVRVLWDHLEVGVGSGGAEETASDGRVADLPLPSGAGGPPNPRADNAIGPADALDGAVKLVVWDLDDTLWAGTLSEGPVTIDPAVTDLVRSLNRRGIVNSICSKNDESDVRHRLEQAGLWSEFVFPRVDWSPKGPRVAQIVEDAQLRPENVLFVDDLAINRAEVGHFVPGIQTAGPEIMEHLLDLAQLTGKDDVGLTRLHQYRLLEQKLADRRTGEETNEDFLRSCDIRVAVYHDTGAQADRLFELSERTNQLNFTKRRPGREAFDAMVADPGYDTGYLRVADRYGEYGICGFYSMSRSDGVLVDFLFSCRVLNMGVEQWLYRRLGSPSLSVVGEVASSLHGEVDWITEDELEPAGSSTGSDSSSDSSSSTGSGGPAQPNRILMVGGCDLTTTAEFLGGRIATEFSHVGPTGAFVHVGHTELLRQSAVGLTPGQREVVERIPFLDEQVFRSPAVVSPDYDVLVYSVLTDYTQGLYRHRRTGLVVPWHQFTHDVTKPRARELLVARFAREGMDGPFFDWFADEFESVGGISVERFVENISWLAGSVPPGARIIFLNGAEVELDNAREPDRHLRHRTMNQALDRVVSSLPNASVCDVRTFVLTEDDVTDNIRHYQRRSYLRMAEEIRAANASELVVEPESAASRAYRQARLFVGRRRMQARRLSRRLRGLPVTPPRPRR
jgi:FkbH-like protein